MINDFYILPLFAHKSLSPLGRLIIWDGANTHFGHLFLAGIAYMGHTLPRQG
jgi:hypothetical protein